MIPIGTDYRMQHRPWTNYALIAANALVFLGGWHAGNVLAWPLMLHPRSPQLHQFFTSMFMHADLGHILGNMVFLWVFGNALNDRLGHVGYLLFYLAGGVLAGLGFLALGGSAPVLGASGAICAVTGAYLVLFPVVRVTILFWFFFYLTTFQVSSLFFLAIQAVWNFYMSVGSVTFGRGGGVAYVAHTSGYLFGIGAAAGLLAARILPRDGYDLLTLLRGGLRRRRYRQTVGQGYDPFGRSYPRGPGPGRRKVTARLSGAVPKDAPSKEEAQLRRDVAAAASREDFHAAAETYLKLVALNDRLVLPRQQQLDIANQLMATERYPAAAEAYERLCRQHPAYEYMADIHLMLGLLYGRYLQRYQEAADMLGRAISQLTDPGKVALAREDLENVRRHLND